MNFWNPRQHVGQTSSGIHVEDVAADVPQFQRVYTVQLDARASMKITAKTFIGDRMISGELTQPNGRWVLFEPERPADKILDPTLLPLIERACTEILSLDRDYISSDPGEFTDERGQKWRREEK